MLVAGVIVAHTTMAWTGVGNWVFRETPVREPLLTLLTLVAALGALFGMSLFFLIAGYFTPRSLERKGLRRFILDRAVRLLVPMLVFVVLLSPPIEFVDPDNAGWTHGFWAFVPEILWPPAPGPTWFLGVLFLFSVAYAGLRTCGRARAVGLPSPCGSGTSSPSLRSSPSPHGPSASGCLSGEERWHLAVGPGPGMAGRIRPRRPRCRAGWLPSRPAWRGASGGSAWAASSSASS